MEDVLYEMTLQRASELVSRLREVKSGPNEPQNMMAIDLFCFFVDTLHIEDTEEFAGMCGFLIATNVERVG